MVDCQLKGLHWMGQEAPSSSMSVFHSEYLKCSSRTHWASGSSNVDASGILQLGLFTLHKVSKLFYIKGSPLAELLGVIFLLLQDHFANFNSSYLQAPETSLQEGQA